MVRIFNFSRNRSRLATVRGIYSALSGYCQPDAE